MTLTVYFLLPPLVDARIYLDEMKENKRENALVTMTQEYPYRHTYPERGVVARLKLTLNVYEICILEEKSTGYTREEEKTENRADSRRLSCPFLLSFSPTLSISIRVSFAAKNL